MQRIYYSIKKGGFFLKISIGSDHAGFELKEHLKDYLKSKGFQVIDVGTNSAESCDYPDFAKAVAKNVSRKKANVGVLICGTGIGMSMAANKVKGIRAAAVHNEFTAQAAKEHNNANIVCLGARVLEKHKAESILDSFFSAKFLGNSKEGERHKRRVEKIE